MGAHPLAGAYAPVPTPLNDRLRPDPEALARHLSLIAGEGLDGALVLGSNGEFPSLTLDERVLIARAAAAAGEGLKLLLNVGSCALPEALALVEVAGEAGYDGLLCPPPFYFRAAPTAGVAAFFRELLERSSLPLLLYHIPQNTGVAVSDALLDALGAHPRLAGVKDSSGSREELERLCRRFRDGAYLVGHDALVTAAREAGGVGSISAAASVTPALVRAAAKHPENQRRLDVVRGLLESYGLGPAVKAILRRRGVGDYRTRPPLLDLNAEREAELLCRWDDLEACGETSPLT